MPGLRLIAHGLFFFRASRVIQYLGLNRIEGSVATIELDVDIDDNGLDDDVDDAVFANDDENNELVNNDSD